MSDRSKAVPDRRMQDPKPKRHVMDFNKWQLTISWPRIFGQDPKNQFSGSADKSSMSLRISILRKKYFANILGSNWSAFALR